MRQYYEDLVATLKAAEAEGPDKAEIARYRAHPKPPKEFTDET